MPSAKVSEQNVSLLSDGHFLLGLVETHAGRPFTSELTGRLYSDFLSSVLSQTLGKLDKTMEEDDEDVELNTSEEKSYYS